MDRGLLRLELHLIILSNSIQMDKTTDGSSDAAISLYSFNRLHCVTLGDGSAPFYPRSLPHFSVALGGRALPSQAVRRGALPTATCTSALRATFLMVFGPRRLRCRGAPVSSPAESSQLKVRNLQ